MPVMGTYIFLPVMLVLAVFIPPLHGSIIPQVDAESIVNFINGVRSTVDPPASDMTKIEWDETLADIAQKRNDTCLIPRGQSSSQSSRCVSGECVEVVGYESGSTSNFIYETLFKWLCRKEKYIYGINPCFLPRHSCGLYTQLVWAESSKIGCSVRRCRHPNTLVFICLFDPPGNTPRRYHPYTRGEPCSNCPPDMSFCENNICSTGGESTGPGLHFGLHLPSGQLLCLTVQREVGMIFKLISTKDLEIIAGLSPDVSNHTWLETRTLGITIAGRKLIFNSTTATVNIDDKITFHYSAIQKITIANRQLLLAMTKEETKGVNHVEVDVQQLGFVFTIVFVSSHLEGQHLDIFWNSGGIDEDDAHGLLSSFLHSGATIDEKKQVLIVPGRIAVPLKQENINIHSDTYQTKIRNCWTVVKNSYQGIGLDERSYTSYNVNVLSTEFDFGVANSTRV